MLENSLIESGARTKTRKPATILASAVIHAVLVVMLVLIPMLEPQAIPLMSAVYALPLPPELKPNVPVEVVTPPAGVQLHIQPTPGDLIAPTVIPADIARVFDAPEAAVGPLARSSPIRSLLDPMIDRGEPVALPPPPEPPAPPPASTGPIRVGGSVEHANLVFQAMPTYPPLARQARVQGAVIMEATISKEGTVLDLRVIKGHPLLDAAAIEAVRQWRYKPTMLNGEAVDVITTITVNFALQ